MQRGFKGGKTEVIADSIENSNLFEFYTNEINSIEVDEFDMHHKILCRKTINIFVDKHGLSPKMASFSRFAKIVAIYLKTIIILGSDPYSSASANIHPPVDEIILKNISKIFCFSDFVKKNKLRIKFDEKVYYNFIQLLRSYMNGKPLWMVEKYWSPIKKSDHF